MKATKKLLLGILVCVAAVIAFQGIANALGAASFTFSGDGIIATPSNPVHVQFNDTSVNANWWQWDFNDGSVKSSVQNATHDFKWANNYTVTLTANDSAGPAAAVQHEVNVLLQVNGNVDYPYNFSIAQLYANCTLNSSVHVPYQKHGDSTIYWFNGTGLSTNDLLNITVPSFDASSVVFTGADGYSRTVSLDSIRNNPDAIIFFDVQSSVNGNYVWLRNIQPGEGYGQNWVKQLVSITVI